MKKLIGSLALALGAALGVSSATAVPVVTLVPSLAQYTVGDTVSVDVLISGLGTEVLSAYDIAVLFDPSILGAVSQGISIKNLEFGDPDFYFIGNFGAGANTNTGGSFIFDDDALAAVQTDDSFVFANFTWDASAAGSTFINFGANPDFERNVVGRLALSLDATFVGACISVGLPGQIGPGCLIQVPEPASMTLAGLALAGMLTPAALRRRREHSSHV